MKARDILTRMSSLPPQWANILAWYRGDIVDGRLIPSRPPQASSTPQVKGSGFTGAGTGTCTGLTTAMTFTATGGDAPTCSVNGTLTIPGDCWDIEAFLDGELWASWKGVNIGGAFELDASGQGHTLYLTTTTITERLDGTGTNWLNTGGYDIADGTTAHSYGPRIQSPGGDIAIGGLAQSLFVASTNVSAGNTLINASIQRRIQQDGPIKKIVSDSSSASVLIFKVFRKIGEAYVFIGESEQVSISSGGAKTTTLAQPIDCLAGDYLGVYIASGNVRITSIADGTDSIKYAAGNITTSSPMPSGSSNYVLNISAIADTPFLAVTGDSIPGGYNEGDWRSMYDGGPSGDIDAEPMHRMSVSIGWPWGNYQNHANGGETWAWVASTGAVSAIATGALAILVHCGVNDINNGRTWAQVEANMNTVAGLLSAGQKLLVGEILPWTNGSDAQAAIVRAWNINYATWCAANGAALIRCHDAMGKIRSTTGELDDLKDEYDDDGVHLLKVGVNALAEIWKAALFAEYRTIIPAGANLDLNGDTVTSTPGPLNVSATITSGTTYPAVTIKAPLGPEFQSITEWTGEAAVDLSTLSATARTRIGPRGLLIYGADLSAADQARADGYLDA